MPIMSSYVLNYSRFVGGARVVLQQAAEGKTNKSTIKLPQRHMEHRTAEEHYEYPRTKYCPDHHKLGGAGLHRND